MVKLATLKNLVPQRDKCRLALQGPHTAAWLAEAPRAIEGTELDHSDFRLALQWWLGVPILPVEDVGERCAQCSGCLDAFGDHAVACLRNGIQKRHTNIQDWLLSTARQAGFSCTREAALPNLERPGDVLFHNWTGGKPLAVDLTVSHPLRPSEPRPTPDKVRKAMTVEEQLKNAKYTKQCASVGWSFRPLAIHPLLA